LAERHLVAQGGFAGKGVVPIEWQSRRILINLLVSKALLVIFLSKNTHG
jgi:hypothetical protein